MQHYKTPGVYIVEYDNGPMPIRSVATAIPAFVGFTQNASRRWPGRAVRISSLAEFISEFGDAPPVSFGLRSGQAGAGEISLNLYGQPYALAQDGERYLLISSLALFFSQGGEACYVVSAGTYDEVVSAPALISGIGILSKEAEVTLLVVPETVLLTPEGSAEVHRAMLAQAEQLGSRLALLDLREGEPGEDPIRLFRDGIGQSGLSYGAAYTPWLQANVWSLEVLGEGALNAAGGAVFQALEPSPSDRQALAEAMATALSRLPPAAAVAGLITQLDAQDGVWRAPANIALANGVQPMETITDADQVDLNNPADGKAVNAIREIVGQGVMVWGARTLDALNEDWRYINVRRTTIMIEQSIRNDLQMYVFSPNDANTWSLVRSQVTAYLTQLWQQGALQGVQPAEAFSVACGLGSTMTSDDLLIGQLRLSVAVALVKPAEFIMLSFQQAVPTA